MALSDSGARGVHVGERMQPTQAPPPGTFEDFFRAEHARLFRALYLATGSRHESDELAQEAFLKVWERWERVRDMEDPPGYLYRVAMNAFRSRLRRPRALPERQRLAMALTDLAGMPAEDAARALGVGGCWPPRSRSSLPSPAAREPG